MSYSPLGSVPFTSANTNNSLVQRGGSGEFSSGNTNAHALGLHNDWNSNYWGPNQLGALSDSTVYNQNSDNTLAVLYGTTDVGGIGNNQSYISASLGLQTGSNLGDDLSGLSSSYATASLWIRTGDIPNDTSATSKNPGRIVIAPGFNTPDNQPGTLLLSTSPTANLSVPNDGRVVLQANNVVEVRNNDGVTHEVYFGTGVGEGGSIDAINHTIINVADPTMPQHAATKNYVDNKIEILPNTTQTLTGGDTLGITKSYLEISSASPVSTSSSAVINSGGIAGQILVVSNVGSNNITIKSGGNVALPGLTDFVLTPESTISFIKIGGANNTWFTIASSIN